MSDYQSVTSPAENGEPRDLLAEPDAPEDRVDEESTDIASAARALGADESEAVELGASATEAEVESDEHRRTGDRWPARGCRGRGSAPAQRGRI